MSRQPIGAIDGDKFVGRMESIRDNARTIYARNAYNFVLGEVRSYIIPSDQGEATRLREALTEAEIAYTNSSNYQEAALNMISIISKVLKVNASSHREDGIQKVRELYEKYVGSDDRKNRGIALGVKLASEALGISVVDGGKPNE